LRLLFIFIDGLGLGKSEPVNPFYGMATPGLSALLDGKDFVADSAGYGGLKASLLSLDATLGVNGLPQSATGQASIFTGINAAAYLGGHLNGFPDQKLRRLLAVKGIFRQLKRKGYKVTFANAYRPPFFELLQRGLPGNRYSCSTLISYYGGLNFYDLEDLKTGRALFMDITNDMISRMGFEVPLITPEEGAARLSVIARNYDFTLFEYFLSDLAGHMADLSEARRVIAILDRFLGALVETVDFRDTILLVTSDHGNLEDLTTRNHTMNKVPALLVGNKKKRDEVTPGLRDITSISDAVYKILQ
jgi:2,3-bisphosphoglycerate-independent phosphoglycerate mutase